jgi:hypothetical protein
MATSETLLVKDLVIDLDNPRTVKQRNEKKAIIAMTKNNERQFWKVAESLLEFGYQPIESILVYDNGTEKLVMEGNRRIGSLKLILGLIKIPEIEIPTNVTANIKLLTKEWRTKNGKVPCLICSSDELDLADSIVARTHGKGAFASRLDWNAVGTARHNRDTNGASEPALDLLEAYLKKGQNVTAKEAGEWAGDFPLTILQDAVGRLARRAGFQSTKELVNAYPSKNRVGLEQLIRDIGL